MNLPRSSKQLLLLLNLCLLLATTAFGQGQVPDNVEHAALKALYDATGGAGWTTRTNWLNGTTAADFGTWYGVTVSNGDVTRVVLPGNNLSGSLPAELGNLTELTHLQLYQNSLSGSLPVQLGSLQKLRYLYLQNNQLSGSIPGSLGGLPQLQELYLQYNSFSGEIPYQLGGLQSLNRLYLNNNSLSGAIPYQLGGLSSLFHLYLNNNLLSGAIPAQLGGMQSLTRLYLNNNLLTGIPEELGNLQSLQQLYIQSNRLTGSIPSTLGNLINVTSIQLQFNSLEGAVPASLVSLPKISSLQLVHNDLTYVPSFAAAVANKANIYLRVNDNKLGFASIEHNLDAAGLPVVNTFAYKPQDSPPTFYNPATQKLYVEVDGTNNQYQWLINGQPVPGATTAEYTITDADRQANAFNCRISNTKVTDLVLNSSSNHTLVEDEGVVDDAVELAALQALYQATGGAAWTNSSGWLNGTTAADFASWHGVTISNGDVVGLALNLNNLQGDLPIEVLQLEALEVLDLQDNQLSSIPGFSSFAGKANLSLRVANNKLGFASIEHNLDAAGAPVVATFAYAPQKQVSTAYDPSTLTLSVSVDGADNLYQWYQNGNLLTGATNNELVLSSSQGGSFYCSVSNSKVSGLTITSTAITANTSEGFIADTVEHAALKALYDATGGAGWTTRTNWLNGTTAADFGTWYGVTVSNGDVTRVVLPGNNLSGSLPAELGNLTELTHLQLYQNSLSGSLPVQLGSLQKLRYLYLQNNQLSGSIPGSLGGLPQLQELYLQYNSFSGEIPYQLGGLQSLNRLYLNNNSLSGAIPYQLGGLSSLFHLYLNNNLLSGAIPAQLGGMQSLTRLYLNNNLLTGIPEELGNLQSLQQLCIQSNRLTGSIPSTLGNLINVTSIQLQFNSLEGAVPASLVSLPKISSLQLVHNDLTYVPSFAAAVANKANIYLRVNDNKLGFASIEHNLDAAGLPVVNTFAYKPQDSPPTFYNPATQKLYVEVDGTNNQYQWLINGQPVPGATTAEYTITDADRQANAFNCRISNTKVTDLVLNSSSNHIIIGDSTGTNEGLVPDAVEYAALKALYDATGGSGWTRKNNWLNGTTAADFDTWAGVGVLNGDVVELYLDGNNMVGAVPVAFADLEQLRNAYLSDNQLTSFPDISKLTRLQQFYVQYNQLASLPSSISSLAQLRQIGAWHNQLTGIPDLSALTQLQYLYIGDNPITALPDLSSLTKLQHLYIGEMNIGSVPSSISNLTELTELDLSTNQLTSIPDLGGLTKLQYLYIGNNNLVQLSGLDNLISLKEVYAAGNKITELPDFSKLTQLQHCYISNNQLERLPASLENLPQLLEFSFSNNKLTAVPGLNSLLSLVYIGIKGNQLTTLPDLSNHPNKANLEAEIQDNPLQFAELEKLFTSNGIHGFKHLEYSPQKPVQLIYNQGNGSLSVTVEGSTNAYQWFKNDNIITSASTSSLAVTSNELLNNTYYCRITNSKVTGLTLMSTTTYMVEGDGGNQLAAPTNLLITNIAADRIGLAWTPVMSSSSVGSVAYNIYSNGLLVNTSPISGNEYTLTGLTAGLSYHLKVTAVDHAGSESAYSTAVTANPGTYQQLQLPIGAGNDDVEEYQSGTISTNSPSLELTYDGQEGARGEQLIGLRFQGLTVPNTAYIEQAYIQFRAYATHADTTFLEIYLENSDSASSFSAFNHNVSNRILLDQKVDWQPAPWNSIAVAGTAERTPDLAPLLRELLAKAKWKTGNPVAFVIKGSGLRAAASLESGGPAKLLLTYSDGLPAAPGALSTTASSEYITLNWQDKAWNEDQYIVQRKPADQTNFTNLSTLPKNSNSYRDLSALADIEYNYRVMATNKKGESAPSNVVNAILTATVPTAPLGLTAQGVGAKQISLSWQDVSKNEKSFVIERQIATTPSWEVVATVGADANSFTDTSGIQAGIRVLYRVKAQNLLGQSSSSNVADAYAAPVLVESVLINAGSTNSLVLDEETWFPDRFYLGGTGTVADILPGLERTLRKGDFSYKIPIAAYGSYNLELKFIEDDYEAAGQRVFNVKLNGEPWLNQLDIHQAVGKGVSLVKTKQLVLNNPVLEVTFEAVTGDASLAALKLDFSGNPEQKRIYVKQDASGLNDGSSWQNAYTSLQAAITAAGAISAPTTITEVWVAEGTYYPDAADRNSSFTLADHVIIYGGFAGDETGLAQRNWLNHATILSGDIGIRNSRSDNSYHVVVANNRATAVLDGFIIEKGYADGTGLQGVGGGVLVSHTNLPSTGFPTLRNLVLLENHAVVAGGGIYVGGSVPETIHVVNCQFNGNYAPEGGGIHLNAGAAAGGAKIINSSFSGNTAEKGGAVYANSTTTGTGKLSIINSTLVANQSNLSAAGGSGGAVYVENMPLELYNNILAYNYKQLSADTAWFDQLYTGSPELAEVKHNLIQGGYGLQADENIDETPRFLQEPHPGEDLSWITDATDSTNLNDYGDLRIEPGSKATDAANSALYTSSIFSDVLGQTRFFRALEENSDDFLDIGAYESQFTVQDSTSYPYFTINTEAIDSTYQYELEYLGTLSRQNAGGKISFNVKPAEVNADSVSVRVRLISSNGIADRQLFFVFLLDKEGNSHSVGPVYMDETFRAPLSKVFYQNPQPHELFISGKEAATPHLPFRLHLSGGLVYNLSESSEKGFVDLLDERLYHVDFQLTIQDKQGNSIYQSTSYADNWYGINQLNQNRVAPGKYKYVLVLDNKRYEGQFLVGY